MSNEEFGLLNRQLNEMRKKEATMDDVMAAKMASFEFPAPIGPAEEPKQGEKDSKKEPPKSEKEVAKQKLIERIQKRFADDERDPAVPSQNELVYARWPPTQNRAGERSG
jgi:hypothetical protein